MIKKTIITAIKFIFLSGFLLFLSLLFVIFYTVYSTSAKAKRTYGGNTVEALSKTLESEASSIKEKNDAVWALGQIADKMALPVLRKYYTGKIPDREPLDKVLSQYELRKAIKWCEKGNKTSWMYKAIEQ